VAAGSEFHAFILFCPNMNGVTYACPALSTWFLCLLITTEHSPQEKERSSPHLNSARPVIRTTLKRFDMIFYGLRSFLWSLILTRSGYGHCIIKTRATKRNFFRARKALCKLLHDYPPCW